MAMEFNGPDSIASGWNTFRYKNYANETHFMAFVKYPDGKNIDSTKAQVFPIFDQGMDLINEGKPEEGYKIFDKLPVWFFDVVFVGGVGLVSPKEQAISTIYLEPGRYLIECYVKMPNGKFHSVMGMYKEIIVTDDKSMGKEPSEETINDDLSSENGFVFNPDIRTGEHLIKVNFKDQKLHEHFLGHDIHLVKLSENANLEELEKWMNWADPKGLITPSPMGVTFLGGMQEMVAGNSGYFEIKLIKGKYAFISEVPSAKSKNLLKVFEVLD